MARIIKSTEAHASAFARYERNVLEELPPAIEEEIVEDDPVARIENEAERVLARAHAEAQLIRNTAYDEGRREGMAAAAAEHETKVGETTRALLNAAVSMQRSHEEFIATLEPDVIRLTSAIVKRIIHREARLDPQLVQQTVRNALENLVNRERVTVRLNPTDFATMREQSIDLSARVEGVIDLVVAPDESVGVGGCIVETDSVTVDARLDEQLNRILQSLSD